MNMMSSELLETLQRNLAELELQRAQYGLRVPLDLLNEIRALQEQITQISSRPNIEENVTVKTDDKGRDTVDEQQRMYYDIDKKLSVLETQFQELQRQFGEVRGTITKVDTDVRALMSSMSPAGRMSGAAIVVSVIAVLITLLLTVMLSVRLL